MVDLDWVNPKVFKPVFTPIWQLLAGKDLTLQPAGL